MLKAELKDLKKADSQFRIMDAGAKYTLFVSLVNANVNETVDKVFKHVEATKRPIGRYVQRFVPILNTCKAYLENIEPCLEHTLKQVYDENTTIKYSCLFKTSNNGSISRENVIKLVNNYLKTKNPSNTIDHDNPDFVVLIQVIRNMCFISYLKDYFNYRKYNLIEMGAKFTNAGKVESAQLASNEATDTSKTPVSNMVDDATSTRAELQEKEPEQCSTSS